MKMSPMTKEEVKDVVQEPTTPASIGDAADEAPVETISLSQEQLKQLTDVLPVLSEILPMLVQLVKGEATIEIIEEEDEEEVVEEEPVEDDEIAEEAAEDIVDETVEESEEESVDEVVEEDIEEAIPDDEDIDLLGDDEESEPIEDAKPVDEIKPKPTGKLNDAAFKGFVTKPVIKPTTPVQKQKTFAKPFASRWE